MGGCVGGWMDDGWEFGRWMNGVEWERWMDGWLDG